MSTSKETMNTVNEKKNIRTLPGKYTKYATFAFWLSTYLRDNNLLSIEAYHETEKLLLFFSTDIQSQIDMYEKFFENSKTIQKDLQTQQQAFLKHSKKSLKPDEKKPKKSKKQLINTNNDIIAQIVLRANSIESPDTPQSFIVSQDNDVIPYDNEEEEGTSVVVEEEGTSVVVVEKKKRVKKIKETDELEEKKTEETSAKKEVEKAKKAAEKAKKEEEKAKKAAEKAKKEEEKAKKEAEKAKKEEEKEKKAAEKEKKEAEKAKKGAGKIKKEKETENIVNREPEAEKNNNNSDLLPIQHLNPDDFDEITLQAIEIDDVEYFYDTDHHLYNSQHNIIGTFNPHTLQVSFT
jgi:hypothetical protein